MRAGRRLCAGIASTWCAAAVACAVVLGLCAAAGRAADATVSPWATGGAKVDSGSTDGKAGVPSAAGAAVPLAQATPWPGYVIQGGAIPKDFQPQAVPYQAIGPDGRAVTLYYAPTYTFTYQIGPPVPLLSPVNRRQAYPQQAYGQPMPANGWNYRAQGAVPPAPVLPPPTVARYQPPPYQFPATAPQLAGQPVAPPAAPLPPPPATFVAAPAAAVPWQPAPVQPQAVTAPPMPPPPSPWGPSAPVPAASSPPVAASPVSLSPQQPPAPAPRAANSHMWRVVGVHDGDTITCLDENNQQQKVRLSEIDAPELGQDFGKVSREALASMVFGKTVEVVDDGKDRYGRWLGHVLVNGADVNREMVATGNAWHYAAYSRDTSLGQLQSQARGQQIGLWAQPNPVPPWDYRASEKKP